MGAVIDCSTVAQCSGIATDQTHKAVAWRQARRRNRRAVIGLGNTAVGHGRRQRGRVDDQAAIDKAHDVVRTGQPIGRDDIAARVLGALAGARITERASQHSIGLAVDKAAVGHAVATSINHAVVGLAGCAGGDAQGRFADRADAAGDCGRQRVVRQRRAAVGAVVANSQVHRHGLVGSSTGRVVRATGLADAGTFVSGETAEREVTGCQSGRCCAVVDLGACSCEAAHNGT